LSKNSFLDLLTLQHLTSFIRFVIWKIPRVWLSVIEIHEPERFFVKNTKASGTFSFVAGERF
jgi:hypothetical protein